MLLQLFFVLVAIVIGARIGGIGLGVMGGIGLAVLTFVFGLAPTAPPIDVMLMIVAVIAAASCMQAAGGLDLMVKWAEKLLRKNPQQITLLSPLVTYFFTFSTRYENTSRTADGDSRNRFAAGYYSQSDLGSDSSLVEYAGRI